MDEMLTTIGAVNVANKKTGWVSMSEENVVKLAPQVIIVTYANYVPNAVQDVITRKGFAQVPAVKNKAVYSVDDDTVSRPGPRLIDGVEALAKAIYPTIFK
jgi:iron complex transport system substrate-binding protein